MGSLGRPKRGEDLGRRILWAARDVFLEVGFERASMDAVAARAGTTKRTVYAHFENKERLFAATFELVRVFFLERLDTPDRYAADPREALVLFCGRFMETLLWEDAIRLARVTASEASRFNEEAAQNCYAIFTTVERRIAAFLAEKYARTPEQSGDDARRLLGRLLYPRFTETLFGVAAPLAKFEESGLSPSFDLAPIRRAVDELLAVLPARA